MTSYENPAFYTISRVAFDVALRVTMLEARIEIPNHIAELIIVLIIKVGDRGWPSATEVSRATASRVGSIRKIGNNHPGSHAGVPKTPLTSTSGMLTKLSYVMAFGVRTKSIPMTIDTVRQESQNNSIATISDIGEAIDTG